MEIPSLVTGQLAKINVHRAAESVPTRKSLLLHALEIPKGIADILKIEVHPTPRKTRPRSAPVSEEMAAQEATEPNATSPIATELNLKWRSPYASGPCLHRSVAEVINDDLGQEETEAHGQNDYGRGHAIGDGPAYEVQVGMRGAGQLRQAARHPE